MIRALCAAVALAVVCSGPAAFAVDATLREDRIKFFVHDLVAGQLTAGQLGGYLDALNSLHLQRSQAAVDVPTCTQLETLTGAGSPPQLYTTNGALPDDYAIVDSEQELLDILNWAAGQGDRVGLFVQDITWCGSVNPNVIGCAPTPGNVFVVSLTASASLRPMVIAHERGHNAGLSHRTDDSCALMSPSASSAKGCLNQTEAEAVWDQANVNTGTQCECIDRQQMGPSGTWSANPAGTPCDDGDACTVGGCNDGLCAASGPVDCGDGNACTADLCDSLSGCSNPALTDGTSCADANLCDGQETCQAGDCTAGTPLVCNDGAFCNGVESCESQLGCQPGTPPPLDDGIACTVDTCDEITDSVVHVPDDGACANGAFCDGDEVCTAGVGCEPGAPPPLDDGVACTDDSCDEIGDAVLHVPDPGLCDDGDPCTAESCDALTGCASDFIPGCGTGVPASSRVGRVALVGALAAGALLAARRRARSG